MVKFNPFRKPTSFNYSGKPWKVKEYQSMLKSLSQIPEYLVINRPAESRLAGVIMILLVDIAECVL